MNQKTPVIVTAILLLSIGCEPWVHTFNDTEDAIYYEAASLDTPPATADTLLVMTWNIKFGGGDINFWFDCWSERVLMTHDEVISNMEGIVDKINESQPDILLLQEVDVESKRSDYLDQLQYILDHTYLNYAVYGSMWQAQFVASDGLGRVNTGQAILSRWPIGDAERIPLDLRSDQDALTTYFYLRRCIVTAQVEVPGQDVWIANVHAAAFSQDGTKQNHIDDFTATLDRFNADGNLFFGGGDLNTLPPGSDQLNNFSDSKCEDNEFEADDYTEEILWLLPLYDVYDTAVPRIEYMNAADQSVYYSHSTRPTEGYTRKLDYLFTNNVAGWVSGSDSTHHDVATAEKALSDHCPVSARVVLP